MPFVPDPPHPVKFTVRGVAAAILVLLVAGVCVRLGFWQLDRLAQRRARNQAVAAATALPPIVLDSAAFTGIAGSRNPGLYAWRRARARGRYLPGGEIALRGRARAGRPGVHVVSPLLVSNAHVVFVERGWVPSPDAATVRTADFRTGDPVDVEGVLLVIPAEADRGMPLAGREGADTTWRRLDMGAASDRVAGVPVLPLYLQQLPSGAEAGPPWPVPLPEPGEGNHLSYAVQWFSFAAIAVIGFAVVALRRKRAWRTEGGGGD